MMKPISFACTASLPLSAGTIVAQILDLQRWPEFDGCWPIPGIRAAEFECQTADLVGTRIRVTDRDGSTHVEEIIAFQPDRQLVLKMHEFSAPLSRLATHFIETWQFDPDQEGTRVTRKFELHAHSALTKLPLRLIAVFLRRAIRKHLAKMQAEAQSSLDA